MSDTALKIWINVPDESRLEVSLDSEADSWSGNARLVTSPQSGSQQQVQWSHAQLHSGPKRHPLASGRGYTVRVRVAFTGEEAATVTMRSRIVKSNGTTYGAPWAYRVRGTNGEVQRATVIAVTKKPGGGS